MELLYRVSQRFSSSLELDDVLTRVMDEVIAATHAQRGFLMLRDAEGNLTFRAARGMGQQTIESPEFQISRAVVERVASEGQPRLTSDAQSDGWLASRASVAGLGLRSILCAPLQVQGATIGVIYVDNRLQAGIFTPDDLDLLSAIAGSAAIAIENARLYRLAVEKGRMERELQMAREVQESLIPSETPQIAGWQIAALWKPAREVAGDYYDLDPSRGLAITIGDVSDKGMGAALFMAVTRSIIRASASGTTTPAQCITQANRLICADAANGMFVTLFYAHLDPTTGELTYVNAGHNPLILYRAASDEWSELTRTGMALGIIDPATFEQRVAQLNAGDFVLLYTDGITDATNAQEEEFGEERLRQVVAENRRASATQIVAAIDRALSAFVGAAAQFDDVTLVVARRTE